MDECNSFPRHLTFALGRKPAAPSDGYWGAGSLRGQIKTAETIRAMTCTRDVPVMRGCQPRYIERCAALLLMLCSVSAAAQYQNAGTINYEYKEKIDQSTNIGPLGDDLFGDSTSYENGATTFSVTDVKAASNVKIPVQLGRTLAVRGSSTGIYGNKYPGAPEIFGVGWMGEVPYIQNDGLVLDGWLANGGRCSGGNFSVSAMNVSQSGCVCT